MTSRPEATEYDSFYQPYLDILPNDDQGLIDLLESSLAEFNAFFKDFDLNKGDYRYAQGKWTVKELVQHMIDAERVFVYRALRFSRGDQTELRGFDENQYVDASGASDRGLNSLVEEFDLMRKSNLFMFDSLNESTLLNKGRIDGNQISVRALGFISVGHLLHHLKIMKERYV